MLKVSTSQHLSVMSIGQQEAYTIADLSLFANELEDHTWDKVRYSLLDYVANSGTSSVQDNEA